MSDTDTLTVYEPLKLSFDNNELGELIGARDAHNVFGFYHPSGMSKPTLFIECSGERFTNFAGIYDLINPDIQALAALGSTISAPWTEATFDVSPTPLAIMCDKLRAPNNAL